MDGAMQCCAEQDSLCKQVEGVGPGWGCLLTSTVASVIFFTSADPMLMPIQGMLHAVRAHLNFDLKIMSDCFLADFLSVAEPC